MAAAGPSGKSSFEPAPPQPLFETHLPAAGRSSVFEYDVTADGKRFFLTANEVRGSVSVPPLTVVVNWDAGLKN
jgi:hypothetical protein